MPKQSLELRIELSGTSESNVENRKMDLLIAFAQAVKSVRDNSIKFDSHSVTINSSFASNLDLFKNLPHSLKDLDKNKLDKNEN